MVVAWQAGKWLPSALALVVTPAGVSHDAWAWAPLALCLLSLVAIAAPTSFRNVLDVVSPILRRRKIKP
jgi:hypothetical protein